MDQLKAILRTLTANILPIKDEASLAAGKLLFGRFGIQANECICFSVVSQGILGSENLNQASFFTKRFEHNFYNPARHRRFFISRNKFMGLGPGQMEKGDFICTLFSCPLPVVLRKVQDHYIFVGEAYFHGWMHGEPRKRAEDGSLQRQRFEIH
jgi:hypothetical protein